MEDHPVERYHDAILLSLSAVAYMGSHPYSYWKGMQVMHLDAVRRGDEADAKHYAESRDRCERVLRDLCVAMDAAMNVIGDANNAVDAVDEYGNTDAAFAAMRRALGE